MGTGFPNNIRVNNFQITKMEKYEKYRENFLSSIVYSGIQFYFCYLKLNFIFVLNATKFLIILVLSISVMSIFILNLNEI